MLDNNSDRILITPQGLMALKKELEELLKKRPYIVERVSESRQAGDLAENSEYTHAREDLGMIDGRIEELQSILARAKVVDNGHQNCSQVNFGCRVIVKNGQGKEIDFYIVGEWEADPASRKISYTSPLGQALLGKKVGDTIEMEAPVGKIVYLITKIE